MNKDRIRQLDYTALRKKAEEEAAIQAALMYPPGHKQDAERKRLADRMYLQYVTPPDVQHMVSLLADGIAAAEGAQVIAELYFEQQSRDPSNNDNYCRLMDWLKAARRHRDKQANH